MGWLVNDTPRPLYARKETQYPLYRRLGGPQGRSELVRKISPPQEFDPRTVQPVASRYTDWAIPAHSHFKTEGKIEVIVKVHPITCDYEPGWGEG